MKDIIIRNIFESMSAGLVVIVPDGEIAAVNSAAANLLGYSAELIELKGWAELFFENEDNMEFNQALIDVIMNKQVGFQKDVAYHHPDGRHLRFSITSSYIRDGNSVAGIVFLFDDITEIFQLYQREQRILKDKNRIQKERLESLSHFADSIAHQVRNSLVTIGGFTKRISKSCDRDDHTPHFGKIMDSVMRLESIVSSVDEYSGIGNTTKQKINILDVIEAARNGIDDTISQKAEWILDIEQKEVIADPELFIVVMREIFMNALYALPDDGGTIYIHATATSDDTKIDIIDSGCGINEKKIPFVFDPFFTTDVTKIGMGLCKVKRIIEDFGGKVTIASEEQQGTTVSVTLMNG